MVDSGMLDRSMLDRAQLSALIPHAGSMCLLDSVLEWTAEWIQCETLTHRDPANPLRRRNALAALHLAEYGAQAMAIHGALVQGALGSQAGPQSGMLGALRDIKLHIARIDDMAQPLSVTATRRLARPDGLIYDFVVALRDSPTRALCEGRISVVLRSSS
jgi:predicted hotdog family 3-hydroxylacyl-ACP dehydratase